MIALGSVAPTFTLNDQRGTPFKLSDYTGKTNVLLLFLPAAFTPICTTELPALAALANRFWDEASTIVAAVTTDNSPSNREWARRCNSDTIFILSDFYPHGAVSQAYGAWIPAEGISDRATVIIGKDGKIKYSESVGKFGKRSIPGLLSMAIQINGGVPPVAWFVSMAIPLDLPVLFVTSSCPHCQRALAALRSLRLDDRIVVRDVGQDQNAMRALLANEPSHQVPTLVTPQGTVTGDDAVIQHLGRIASNG